jgi:hypothetical protein
MASIMSAIVPLLGDNRTQRRHHQNDVNDPNATFVHCGARPLVAVLLV